MGSKPTVAIEYCTVCNFRGRAAWIAQELLASNEADVDAVTLVPGRGGIFEVRVDGDLLFSYKEEGCFPELRELKDALREKLGLEPAPRHE